MRKIILTGFTILLGFTAAVPTGVLAVSVTPTLGAKAAANLTAKETALRNRANLEIDRRVTALNLLMTRLNVLKHLPVADKTNYVTQIQAEITSLTTLKTKITADTDVVTLKTDVQSIVTAYRVFALFIPKIHLLAAADSMTEAATALTNLTTFLSTQINSAQTAGKNVTALQTLLTDMTAKILDAKTQYQTVETLLLPLVPEGYPGNKTSLLTARTDIKAGAQDLKTARDDALKIRDGLKSLKTTTTQATTSATTP